MNQPAYRRILPRDCAEAQDGIGRGGNNWHYNLVRELGWEDDEAEHAAAVRKEYDESLAEREKRIEAHRGFYTCALAALPEVLSGVHTEEQEATLVADLERDWEGTVARLRSARWEGL